jgi:hypothetical protein
MRIVCSQCLVPLRFDEHEQVWVRRGAIVAVSGMRCRATGYVLSHDPVPSVAEGTDVDTRQPVVASRTDLEAWLAS